MVLELLNYDHETKKKKENFISITSYISPAYILRSILCMNILCINTACEQAIEQINIALIIATDTTMLTPMDLFEASHYLTHLNIFIIYFFIKKTTKSASSTNPCMKNIQYIFTDDHLSA